MSPVSTTRTPRWTWILLVAGLLGVEPAAAQFVQYAPPGEVVVDAERMEQILDKALKDAKWWVGRWYVSPWLGLRDIAVVDGGDDAGERELSVSAGIGLRFFRPVGAEWTFAAHLLPEYVWQETESQRRLNGRYGAGLFGNLGRLGVEATVTRQELAQVFSRQFEDQVNLRQDRAQLALALDLGGGFGLRGVGSLRRFAALATGEGVPIDLGTLDREETVLRSLLEYRSALGLTVGVGVEAVEVAFEQPDSPLSNSGTSPVIELSLQGKRLRVEADLALRELEFDDPGRPMAYDDVTGRAQLTWKLIPPLELELFGRRELVYSFDSTWAYFEDTATGVGARFSVGRRLGARLFAERGENPYFTLDPLVPVRLDDFDAFGGELRIEFGRATLVLRGTRTEYRSSLPQFDRSTTVLGAGLALGRKGAGTWG